MKDRRVKSIDKSIEDKLLSLKLMAGEGGGGIIYTCLKCSTILHTRQCNVGHRHKRANFISWFTFQGSSIRSQVPVVRKPINANPRLEVN